MWKAVIFEDNDEKFLEDGSNPVSKKLKGGTGLGKAALIPLRRCATVEERC